MDNKIKIALIYDFDNTLIKGDMQDCNFFDMLNIEKGDFWEFANKLMQENDMDGTLAYMYAALLVAKRNSTKVTKQMLIDCGKKISSFYPGVIDWFDRINQYANSLGLDIEHYVVSGGYRDMIENSKIAKYLTKVFACEYMYENGEAVWPAYVVNYTQKMQYIARIKKHLVDVLYDSKEINKKFSEKEFYIPYTNMMYIGDGETDIPSMVMVKDNGGKSICVYDKDSVKAKNVAKTLLEDGRVDCSVVADYTEGSEFDIKVKAFLKEFKNSYDNK